MSGDRPVRPDLVIPTDRLPRGFADAIDSPPTVPVPPVPAATVVLLRDSAEGPEALLLRRSRQAGFVPGAYVFPGGRVDDADADPTLLERMDSLDSSVHVATPDLAYRVAAVREVFEETGVLLARVHENAAPDAASDSVVARWREALLEDRATLATVLQALDARLDPRVMVYCGHWITPVAERRRYDTRFFLAALPPGRAVTPDAREMTDALWLTPEAALARFAEGKLQMVFPTVKTLESMSGFAAVPAVMAAFRGRAIAPVMPRLVRTAEGVGFVIDRSK